MDIARNFKNDVKEFRKYIDNNILLTDGAFGTYYASIYDTNELPENANIDYPDRVKQIHRQYISAGAKLLRTNTYASNSFAINVYVGSVDVYASIKAACRLAKDVVTEAGEQVFVAGDIGPIIYEHLQKQEAVQQEYINICKCFIEAELPVIVFETFSELDDIKPAIEYIKNNSDTFVIVQFAVSQFGYSSSGLSARRLFEEAGKLDGIDAVGLNCGVGPGHMHQILSRLDIGSIINTGKYITALPNSGYPQNISNRMTFSADNKEYFATKVKEIAELGIRIAGGCCGTTPDYIKCLKAQITGIKAVKMIDCANTADEIINVQDNAFYADINRSKRSENISAAISDKLIAVELAPPLDSDDSKLMEAAHILKKSGVDVLTFPDSPSGRTRIDSVLMAEKVSKETGLCVMPHLCCRDKNAIAMRSQLLGAHINKVNNFLVITGDPIPSMMRQSVKAVFNFDSVGLMNIIKDMNSEQFKASPICYGGAINQNRRNFDIEIKRVIRKMEAGATFFLTQPVFDKAGADKLYQIKKETGARILCGIMPLVSLKNAVFMKNEMTGIDVSDEIIKRYENCVTKEQGEEVGITIAKEVIELTKDFVDGYYFSFPFNRVYMLEKIIN